MRLSRKRKGVKPEMLPAEPPAFESIDALKEYIVAENAKWFPGKRANSDLASVAGIDRQLAKAKEDYCLVFWFSTHTDVGPCLSLSIDSMLVDRRTGKGLPRHYRQLTPAEEYEKSQNEFYPLPSNFADAKAT